MSTRVDQLPHTYTVGCVVFIVENLLCSRVVTHFGAVYSLFIALRVNTINRSHP